MRINKRVGILVACGFGLLAGGFLLGRMTGGAASSAIHHAGGTKYWICKKHGHLHEGPGTCPVDGEELIPATEMEGYGAKKTATSDRKVKYWRSPMDPTFVSKAPGKDNMGMDLVAVYEGDAESEPGVITVAPNVVLQMGVRTDTIKVGELVRRIRAIGTVAYNEETLGTVTTKLGGWVEKLYVDKTGQAVKVGDPLFDLYSKEMEAAQSAFIQSLKDPRLTSPNVAPADRLMAQGLLESTRRRLEYWDIPPAQIDAIAKEGRVRRTVTILSPFSGIVTHKNAVEGRFFKPGAPLFEIADLSTVWVYAKIYEFERPWVKVGQKAEIRLSYIPGKTYEGLVEYVYPYLNEKTRDITVRLRFPNAEGILLPGMFAKVVMDCSLGTKAALVPEDAVLDTGTRKVVFLARGAGQFEGREVSLGVQAADGMWEVLDGLKAGDRVVVSGQFMLDAESKVREAILKFLNEGAQAGDTAASPPMDMPMPKKPAKAMEHSGSKDDDDR